MSIINIIPVETFANIFVRCFLTTLTNNITIGIRSLLCCNQRLPLLNFRVDISFVEFNAFSFDVLQKIRTNF